MKNYRIKLTNQLDQLRGIIIGVPILGLLFYYFYQQGDDLSPLTLILFSYFGMAFAITVFIHCEYYKLNKGRTVIIDIHQKTISFSENQRFSFENVEKITVMMTQLLYRPFGNIMVLPSDPYNYAIIQFSNKKEFIFTSLLTSDVEKAMKTISGTPIERKLRPIPSPMLARLFGLK